MNNQAFRELVNNKRNGGPAKTTKEIAREAVEEELQELKRKRKSKSGDGGDFDGDFNISDDEYDGDNKKGKGDDKAEDDEGKNNNQNKKGRWKKKSKKNDDDEDQSSSNKHKYRDRAKERREGKNVDYRGTENISLPSNGDPSADGDTTSAQYKNEMTKFLGGDEEFTHLVKGLDKSLADKVRREEMLRKTSNEAEDEHQGDDHDSANLPLDGDDIDLDQVMEDAKASQSKMKKNKVSKPATSMIGEKKSSSSSLVSSMASYIQKVEEHYDNKSSTATAVATFLNSGKGKLSSISAKTIHRSKVTFSLQENQHNLQQYGWEIPKVSVMSNSQYVAIAGDNNDEDDVIAKASFCTPLDSNLIQRIKSVLDSVNAKSLHKKSSSSSNNKKKKTSKLQKDKNNGDLVHSTTNKKQLKTQVDDDSDDDIYGDIGDYVPSTVKQAVE
eukprot:CAMPEP_0203674456 /NCGR_PEP_ID=MMETSP0090-20130426/16285_1 /ASSEMBLY_ACC=CAM_ASM_001088 /TAXON_ID=426623 /ORGANISM="Chaetoceros affinis, Strain CCMP159" /LENGTH=441 /DNA_ID=CAMNT_0050540341 /DNA_START=38 /DNA_END=1363 /DNA_ORIENTATION=+